MRRRDERLSPRGSTALSLALAVSALAVLSGNAHGEEKASHQVSPFYGSFSWTIPIQVPAYHGIEPRLVLGYNSEGRNGFAGVGWNIGGFSLIEKVSPGRGIQRDQLTDVYLFDGQELVSCNGISSPGCAANGNWATKIESYLKIQYDSGQNKWYVWGKDGTKTTYTALGTGSSKWGQSEVRDTKNNVVSYTWTVLDGDAYPSSVSFGPYTATLYRETTTRPDILSFADTTQIAETKYRLQSVLVALGASKIRAYNLTYTQSPHTGRSLLASVQQYGTNVAIDGNGTISGGTTLPAQTFTYSNDTLGKTFQSLISAPPTTPTTENVEWVNLEDTTANNNTLTKTGGVDGAYDAAGISNRAIMYGNGYVQVSGGSTTKTRIIGLSNGDTDVSDTDIDFGIELKNGGVLNFFENGTSVGSPGTFTSGDTLKVEVANGQVRYVKNGVIQYTSAKTPIYPLLVDASLKTAGSSLNTVVINGPLQYVATWCTGVFGTGDFNGDGRTDQACTKTGVGIRVMLANNTGFGAPTTWTSDVPTNPLWGDFNGDGRTDYATYKGNTGDFKVALSTGAGFNGPLTWGSLGAGVCYGGISSVGEFSGDGITDVFCQHNSGKVYVGISNGSAFSLGDWGSFGCDTFFASMTMELDGDGKSDWVCEGSKTLFVYRAEANAFASQATATLGGNFCDTVDRIFGDFNGDGKTDVACRTNSKIAFSTGRGFVEKGVTGGAWCDQMSDLFGADVDGDGVSEIVCNNKNDPTNDIEVREWDGTAETSPLTWKGSWCDGKVSPGDYNGDGKTDLYCGVTAAIGIAGTGALQSDVVIQAQNGLGATTTVSYVPSTQFTNNGGNPPPRCVVTNLTVQDGRGGSSAMSYSYSGAKFDHVERQFLGFQHVKETLPCIAGESACPYIDTYLNQDLASAGKIDYVERRDGSGTLLSKQKFEYTLPNQIIPRVSLLLREWKYSFDPTGIECVTWPCSTAKRTKVEHSYDSYANRTQTISYGEFDTITGDEVTTVWGYDIPNTGLYIVNKPSHQDTFAGAGPLGTLLASQHFTYDAGGVPTIGNLTKVGSWLDPPGRYVERTFGYDGYGNQTSVTDETDRPITTAYDTTYHLLPVLVTNGAGEREETTWNFACSTPLTKTDANNQQTVYQPADALCRQTRMDAPLGYFELYSYTNLGSPSSQAMTVESPGDSNGNDFVTAQFDGHGRTYRTVSRGPSPSDSIVQETSYNARGSVASQTAPFYEGDAVYTTTFEYDAADRRTRTVHPDGHDAAETYDLWETTTYDENEKPTTTRSDAYGRAVEKEVVFGSAVTTSYTYDLLGHLTGIDDARGNHWGYTFDTLGRNTQKGDPDAGVWNYEYDDAGRMKAQIDAKLQRIEFTYDLAGRLATKTALGSPNEVTTISRSEQRNGYFNVGRITTVSSPNDTLSTDYDALGREVKLARMLDAVNSTIEYRYDSGGRVQGITYPDGDVIGSVGSPWTYDAAGRLKSIPGIVSDVTYDASGRSIVQTNANPTVTTKTYDPERGFLLGVTTTPGNIQQLVYTPDPVGMISQVTSTNPNESWTYGYDDLYHLTQATSTTNPSESQTFTYDELGRMLTNSQVGTYTYPSDGSARPHAPLTAGSGPNNSYSYDANGNMYSGGGRTVTWNRDSRPSQVTVNSLTTTFTYDGFGERLKTVRGTNASRYPFGDDYEVTNGTVTKYVSAPGLGLVAKRVGSTTYWIHTDRLGSIQAITDGSGVVQRRTYRPYGGTIADLTGHVESRGWANQRSDSQTGLTYLHARYYDPTLGIFLSPDPLDPADPAVGTNRYSYAFGDPINRSDPSGKLVNCWLQVVDLGTDYVERGGFQFIGGQLVYATYVGVENRSVPAIECAYYPEGPYLNDPGVNDLYFGLHRTPRPPLTDTDTGMQTPGGGDTGGGDTETDEGEDHGDGMDSEMENAESDTKMGGKPSESASSYSQRFADCVEQERFDLGATLGTLGAEFGVGTMPKTALELRGFGPRENLDPFTNQLSRLTSRTGVREFRDLGRSAAGKAVGRAALALTVFEGFYDIGAIGRCAVVSY